MSQTFDLPLDHGLDVGSWQRRVAADFAPAEVSPTHNSFTGTMRTYHFDSLRLSRSDTTSHVLERTRRHIGAHPESYYVLCLQLEGDSVVAQDGKSATLRPGDATIYHTAHPYRLTFDSDVKTIGVVISQHALSLPTDTLDALTAQTMSGDMPATAASLQAIRQYERGIHYMDTSMNLRVERTILGLFETLTMHQALEIVEHVDERSIAWDTVLHYIDNHLASPELNPESIAAEHFMSVRSLHKLAQHAGTTVAKLIRTKRLERCRADLVDPLLDHLTVAEIGGRWGYIHAPHFTTLFRKNYGVTPAMYRKLRAGTSR